MSESATHPESEMMSAGHHPEKTLGSLKVPIFQTSSYEFQSAEQGAEYFEWNSGLKMKPENGEEGFIYGRLSNPNAELVEKRLSIWEAAEACVAFESGMAAISTTLLALVSPGETIFYSRPLYAGTEHFLNTVATRFGIHIVGFDAIDTLEDMKKRIHQSGLMNSLRVVYVETPANPTNILADIHACRALAGEMSTPDREVLVIADNTYSGPIWQQPLKHGADIVLYSATKYLGGHSDIIAGASLGKTDLMQSIRKMRSSLGSTIAPMTAWLLTRSLETLRVRMLQQESTAIKVAAYLSNHPYISTVLYPALLSKTNDAEQFARMNKQMTGKGAMISFHIKGGKPEAFRFLNALKLIHLAVSLGSTESLASHPATMSHLGVSDQDKIRYCITDSLIRLSIGLENEEDIIADLDQALGVLR